MSNDPTTIGIIGAGHVGATLGRRFAGLGLRVTYGARDPAKTAAMVLSGHPGTASVDRIESLRSHPVVLLATPWSAANDAVQRLDPPAGQILIDATNPIRGRLEGLDPGGDDSGGEAVQRAAPHAHVVKAFNTCGYEVMADPVFADGRAALPVCGDDATARAVVMRLAERLGFRPLEFTALHYARYTEPLAMVWIARAILHGAGRRWAFGIVGG
jgi:hypothetical protein